MMTIDLGKVLTILGIVSTLGGFGYGFFKLFLRFRKLERESAHRKEDTEIILKALLAILDGLKERGCNGTVTTTRDALQNYIISSR